MSEKRPPGFMVYDEFACGALAVSNETLGAVMRAIFQVFQDAPAEPVPPEGAALFAIGVRSLSRDREKYADKSRKARESVKARYAKADTDECERIRTNTNPTNTTQHNPTHPNTSQHNTTKHNKTNTP